MARLPRRRFRRSPLPTSALISASAVLSGGLLSTGLLHFAVPSRFDTIVPRWLPGTARFWTYASGAAELAVAGAVAAPRTRHAGGLAAVALFVAVYPANLQMAWDWRLEPWPYRAVAFGRLPLQAPMISHALRVSREAPTARHLPGEPDQ